MKQNLNKETRSVSLYRTKVAKIYSFWTQTVKKWIWKVFALIITLIFLYDTWRSIYNDARTSERFFIMNGSLQIQRTRYLKWDSYGIFLHIRAHLWRHNSVGTWSWRSLIQAMKPCNWKCAFTFWLGLTGTVSHWLWK